MAKELNVKIFTAEIIYHLFDKFTAYMAEVRKEQQEKAALTAVFPCVCEISSPSTSGAAAAAATRSSSA